MPVACFLRVDASGQICAIHHYWGTDAYFGQLQITRAELAEMLTSAGADDGR